MRVYAHFALSYAERRKRHRLHDHGDQKGPFVCVSGCVCVYVFLRLYGVRSMEMDPEAGNVVHPTTTIQPSILCCGPFPSSRQD